MGPKAVVGNSSLIGIINDGAAVYTTFMRASMIEASASAAGTAREETRPENRQRTEVKTATFIVIVSLVKTEESEKIFEIRCQKKSEAVVVLLGSREDGEKKTFDMGALDGYLLHC